MAKGYMIARIKVTDPEQFAIYAKLATIASTNFGARSIVRGGRYETMEGDERERNVVLEFESYDKALEYYNSDAYQSAKKERANACIAEFVIVEGVS